MLRHLYLLLVLIASGFAGASNAGELQSVSAAFFREQGASGYWEAAVKCIKPESTFFLRKEENDDLWCGQTQADRCDNDKSRLAALICSQVLEITASTNDRLLRIEKMAIEVELLEIQERKLELSRQELELRKKLVQADGQ